MRYVVLCPNNDQPPPDMPSFVQMITLPTPAVFFVCEVDDANCAVRIAQFNDKHIALRVATLLNRNGMIDVPLTDIEAP